MKIKAITYAHRNDFSADMVCEHCGAPERLTTGYNDAFYHERVIPAMHCPSCGKNRAGDLRAPSTPVCDPLDGEPAPTEAA